MLVSACELCLGPGALELHGCGLAIYCTVRDVIIHTDYDVDRPGEWLTEKSALAEDSNKNKNRLLREHKQSQLPLQKKPSSLLSVLSRRVDPYQARPPITHHSDHTVLPASACAAQQHPLAGSNTPTSAKQCVIVSVAMHLQGCSLCSSLFAAFSAADMHFHTVYAMLHLLILSQLHHLNMQF